MHIVICDGPSLFANCSQIVGKLLQTGGWQPEQFSGSQIRHILAHKQSHPHPSSVTSFRGLQRI